jgi:hypothetical protein
LTHHRLKFVDFVVPPLDAAVKFVQLASELLVFFFCALCLPFECVQAPLLDNRTLQHTDIGRRGSLLSHNVNQSMVDKATENRIGSGNLLEHFGEDPDALFTPASCIAGALSEVALKPELELYVRDLVLPVGLGAGVGPGGSCAAQHHVTWTLYVKN